MKQCEHTYKNKSFTYSMLGYISVCEKCGKVTPFANAESYYEYILKKVSCSNKQQ